MTPHNRQEGNWRKVIELATQLREKPDKQHKTLGWFLVGEGKLEEYLEEFPAKEENVREAKSCLERTIQVFKKTVFTNWKSVF